MNKKFYSLPETKRQSIINAGFQVFSQNSYKKAPMQEIADQAGISKSLLFHYFQNKKELYLFLWDYAANLTMQYLKEYKCYEPDDLFEMMEREMYLASEGYLWEIIHWNDTFHAEILEKDFNRMLAFWKSIYLRKEV